MARTLAHDHVEDGALWHVLNECAASVKMVLLSSRAADRKRTWAKGHAELAPTSRAVEGWKDGGRISRERPDGQGHGGKPAEGRTPGQVT
jgi:hypothetical protein